MYELVKYLQLLSEGGCHLLSYNDNVDVDPEAKLARWERAYDLARLMALTTPRRVTRLSEIVYDLKIRLAPP